MSDIGQESMASLNLKSDPIREYEKKKRIEAENAAMGIPILRKIPLYKDESPAVKPPEIGRMQRAPRRSRSASSFLDLENSERDEVRTENAETNLNREQSSSRVHKLQDRSMSLVSLNVSKTSTTGSRGYGYGSILTTKIRSIANYLEQFGYENCSNPEFFCLKYDGLTGQEYWRICKFVESQIGDEDSEGMTTEEIIASLIEFAVGTNYPVPITRTVLLSPMAPAMKPRTICFLLWMCTRVYEIKYAGCKRGLPSTDKTVVYENVTHEQIACQVYLQSCKGGVFDLTRYTEEYRESRRNIEFYDLEDIDDLIQKRNAMRKVLVKENKNLETDRNQVNELALEDAALAQHIDRLKKRIKDKEDYWAELRNMVKKREELTFAAMQLANEVAELEKKQQEEKSKGKVDDCEVEVIKNEIKAAEVQIKEQKAIQKSNNAKLANLMKKKGKLQQASSEFVYNSFPSLNSILEKIGMSPIQLVRPNNAEDFIKQMKIIGDTIERAEHILNVNTGNSQGVENENEVGQPYDEDDSCFSLDEESNSGSEVSPEEYDLKEKIQLYDYEIEELRTTLAELQESDDAGDEYDADDEREESPHTTVAPTTKLT